MAGFLMASFPYSKIGLAQFWTKPVCYVCCGSYLPVVFQGMCCCFKFLQCCFQVVQLLWYWSPCTFGQHLTIFIQSERHSNVVAVHPGEVNQSMSHSFFCILDAIHMEEVTDDCFTLELVFRDTLCNELAWGSNGSPAGNRRRGKASPGTRCT